LQVIARPQLLDHVASRIAVTTAATAAINIGLTRPLSHSLKSRPGAPEATLLASFNLRGD
jgi:hypothetical protein